MCCCNHDDLVDQCSEKMSVMVRRPGSSVASTAATPTLPITTTSDDGETFGDQLRALTQVCDECIE